MRISRHQMFMEMAYVVSKRSTCVRENVGAVVVSRIRVESIGYNGAPAGEPHCIQEGIGCEIVHGSCRRCNHAEANALMLDREANGDILYTTHSPCMDCVSLIIAHGSISKVYFCQQYKDTTPILRLGDIGIEVYRITPNGHIAKLQ